MLHFSFVLIYAIINVQAVGSPNGRAVECVGLKPLTCRDCGFKSRQGHGCLSVVSVVCCQVEIPATGVSLIWRSPTECGVCNLV
jgi:hypothetical protein